MSYWSAMNLTTLGGSTRMRGFRPKAVSSVMWGLNQFTNVPTLTPANSANSLFDFAFIAFIVLNLKLPVSLSP